MNTKQSSVNIDQNLAEKAVKLARVKNLPRTLRGVIRHLLKTFNDGKLNADYDPDSFDWSANWRTSITYDESQMSVAKSKMKMRGLADTNEFVVNFLLLNFIKNE